MRARVSSCVGPVVAAVVLAAAPLQVPAAGVTVDGEGPLPAVSCRNLFIVTVEYGGDPDRSLDFVLDTGADETFVDPDSIEREFGRRARAGRRVTLRGASTGPIGIARQKVRAAELDHLGWALGRPIDGILGFRAFRDLLLVLDYPAGEVRVREGRLPPVNGTTVFEDVGARRPFLAVAIPGRTVRMLLDSGFTGTLDLRPGEIDAWVEPPRGTSATVKFSRVEIVETGRARGAFRIGPLAVPDPIARESDGTRLVGAKIMRHAVWTFDAANDRIRIEPVDDAPVATEPFSGTGAAFRPVSRGLEVVRVFPGTPADEAGLEPGDVIVAGPEGPVHERGCEPLVPEGTGESVPLDVERDGRTRTVMLRSDILVP